ncbi:MAG: ABC transporter ATP-binding protein [Spirochaetes bacterium]|nr:MAG: ABC transporter ATP-binding protein [Spirochaetota bacterium]
MTADGLLNVNNLNVAYGEAKALFDVSIEINKNEVVSIVGRNGAGKTTLLRTISGFLEPVSGSVIFNNQDITGMPAFKLAKMGIKYVPQDKMVFSDLTVRENLELSSYGTGDYNWEGVLGYFPRLKKLLNNKGGYLSGGERQMVMIARALLGKPPILLIDEPTEGLAPNIVNDLIDIFKRIREDSVLVIVEQNLTVVSGISDKVYPMKEGKIVSQITDREQIKSVSFENLL